MASGELADLLTELASTQRLDILANVSSRPRLITELAPALSRSLAETWRHLDRLTTAGLVSRRSRKGYRPTPLACVVRAGLPFFEYVAANRRFIGAHDLSVLDERPLTRLVELRRGEIRTGRRSNRAEFARMLQGAKHRSWLVLDSRYRSFAAQLRSKATSGVNVRLIVEESQTDALPPVRTLGPNGNILRFTPHVRMFLAVVDDQAVVSFPAPGEDVDHSTMILLNDRVGIGWVHDLFLDYWSRATPIDHIRNRGEQDRSDYGRENAGPTVSA